MEKALCIKAARLMYAAGRQLCGSVTANCRKQCRINGAPGDLRCCDGIVAATEECDPPGWAGCRGGSACGPDCSCPVTTSTSLPPP